MAETRKQYYQKLLAALKNERSSFEPAWRDLSDFIKPSRARFVASDVNKGDRRWKKIINAAATFGNRTLQAGMTASISSPARPWYRLTTPDPSLAEFGPVKAWLDDVREITSAILLRSNVYNKLPIVYGDMATFGTGAMATMEDDETFLRCYDFPVGSYYIANDERLQVRVFAREFRLTVRQLVKRYGRVGANGQPDWSIFSTAVRNAWDRSNYEQWIDVVHVVDPNPEYDPQKILSRYKPFSSCAYEQGGEGDKLLEEKGFDEFPILVPRWEVTGEDVYGTDSPGWTALGDVMQLQHGERKALQAIDKHVSPPMVAPTGMKNSAVSVLPGGVTYADVRQGQQGFQPAYQIDPRIDTLEAKQRAVEDRIDRAYYVDLFLMLERLDRAEITATEILERKEEKLLVLGPMLEQLNGDLLNPLIDRVFAIANRRGMIPPPPRELEGLPLKVEYESIMAQAQKQAGLASLDRFSGFVGQVAAYDPSILDKVDRDQMVDEYGERSGVPPRIIVPDEQVAAIRQARAKAAQAQQAAEAAAKLAPAAKQLSETDVSGDNALAALLGAGGGGLQ